MGDKSMPKISVIMPVFNGEKYLSEAMDSILNQTFTDFEFIIINDASKDSTEEIIKSYTDERIVYIKNEQNLGVARTLNRGLELAKGEYIARMDADDIALPERFKKQVNYMDEHEECVLCGSNVILFGAQEGITEMPSTDAEIRANLIFSTSFPHPTIMMRRSFVEENNLRYDLKCEGFEDYNLWVEFALLKKGEFYNFPTPMLKYRIHPHQVTQKELSPQKKEILKQLKTRALGVVTDSSPEKYPILLSGENISDSDTLVLLYDECEELFKNCDRKYHQLIKYTISAIGRRNCSRFSTKQVLKLLVKYRNIRAYNTSQKVYAFVYIAKKVFCNIQSVLSAKYTAAKNRLMLKNKNFTIISNNCWGGLISQKYGLPYRSPTCGLLILGEDYIKFCANLKHYLSQKIEFVDFSEGKYSHLFKGAEFPVGKLGDIEIYFMHYHSNEEAAEKWYRRASRVNFDCIIYKISERETFTPEIMQKFIELPLENKLIFASKKYTEDTIVVPELNTFVGDETPLLAEYFDEAKYLNKLK